MKIYKSRLEAMENITRARYENTEHPTDIFIAVDNPKGKGFVIAMYAPVDIKLLKICG